MQEGMRCVKEGSSYYTEAFRAEKSRKEEETEMSCLELSKICND